MWAEPRCDLSTAARMAYDWSMRMRILGMVCLLVSVGEPVLAECSDVPAPGVYWRRCLQDAQDLRDVDLAGAVLRDASFKRADLSGANLIGAGPGSTAPIWCGRT
jgi:hypothetical protein